MRLLIELAPVLQRVHGSRSRTRSWLRSPNRHLGGSTPIAIIASSTAWVRWLIDNAGLVR